MVLAHDDAGLRLVEIIALEWRDIDPGDAPSLLSVPTGRDTGFRYRSVGVRPACPAIRARMRGPHWRHFEHGETDG